MARIWFKQFEWETEIWRNSYAAEKVYETEKATLWKVIDTREGKEGTITAGRGDTIEEEIWIPKSAIIEDLEDRLVLEDWAKKYVGRTFTVRFEDNLTDAAEEIFGTDDWLLVEEATVQAAKSLPKKELRLDMKYWLIRFNTAELKELKEKGII